MQVELPFLGVSTTWSLSSEEQQAAWKLLVELVTRTSVAHLADDEGSDQAALASLHSLFGTVREILREHGVDTGADRDNGSLPFATVAVRILNDVIRPVTTRWHPLLESHHARNTNTPKVPSAEWEQTCWGGPGAPLHVEFRRDLAVTRDRLRQFIFVLAKAAGASEFGSTIEADIARGGPGLGGGLYANPATADVGLRADQRVRRHMVRWFDPVVGAVSLYRIRKTSSDDRDAQPAGTPQPTDVGTGGLAGQDEDVWFDYAADMGDAFDPTMQVAWTLGRQALTLHPADRPHETETLERGQVLILGGDEIYPYPSDRYTYDSQLTTPYEVGFEDGGADRGQPMVLALPGNHDWYGGLGPWRQVFTDNDTFGGWAAPQSESWWSVRLPYGWWVWGLDTHLDGTINDRQRHYFAEASNDLEPGDQVILCTPVPLWRLREKHPDQLVAVERFVRDLIDSKQATARLYLGGDSHIFAAYERHRLNGVVETHLTSGGAGAFLQPTHNLAMVVPQTDLQHPAEANIESAPFVEGRFWPPPSRTHRLLDRRALRGALDRQSRWLFPLLALVHGLYGLAVGPSIRSVQPASGWSGLVDVFERLSIRWTGSLASAIMLVVAVGAGVAIARPNTAERAVERAARRAGALHGLAQAAAFAVTAGVASWLSFQSAGDEWTAWAPWIAVIGGGIVGASVSLLVLFAFLVRVNRRWRINDNEAFAAHHAVDGKHFLRFRLSPDRTITAYLVGIDTVRPGWEAALRKGQPLPPQGDGLTQSGSGPGGSEQVATVPWMARITPHVEPVRFAQDGNRRVALSASMPDDVTADDAEGQQISQVFQQTAQLLLLAGFDVAYGGDHRHRGLTQRLADAARGTIGFRGGRVHNYLAATEREALGNDELISGVHIVDIEVEPGPERFARELSEMRQRVTDECIARVVIGGKFYGAAGFGPGVLEEARLSIAANHPLVMLGGFGGVAGHLARGLKRAEGDREEAEAWEADQASIIASLDADLGYQSRTAAANRSMSASEMLQPFAMPADGAPVEIIADEDPSSAARATLEWLRRQIEDDRLAADPPSRQGLPIPKP